MKSIKELPHAYKVVGIYVMVDKWDTDFRRGAVFQQIKYDKNYKPYIWFDKTTYQLDNEERRA